MMDELKLPEEKRVVLQDTVNNIKVVAGPGSGKTTLIIEKVKKLIDSGVKPNKILVITYTNKAAEDLEKKILRRLPNQKGIYVSTIHGFCTRFIREYSLFFQDYRDFKVLDELGQFLFIVKNINLIKTDDLPYMSNLVFNLKNYFGRIKDNYSYKEMNQKEHKLKQAYKNYCSQLKYDKKFDFGDLINVVITAIQNNKELKEIVDNKFKYLFIDEYQDINGTQERLIKLFHNKNNQVMVVGDINQSIYGFRGADIRIFQNFNKSFNQFYKVKEYSLKINFRSTNNIIELSNKFLDIPKDKRIIGNQDNSIGEVTEHGIKPKLFIYDNKEQEAKEIANYIKKLHEDKKISKYSDVSILFRSVKRDAKRFIDELEKLGIKYEVIGDGSLFQLDYIKAILDCFENLAKGEDIKNEFLSINIIRESKLHNKLMKSMPLTILFKLLESSRFIANTINDDNELVLYNIAKLTEIINEQQQMFSNNDHEKFIIGLKKLDKSFLDTEQPVHSNIDSVKLLTLHRSKGLEYPLVIIPGVTKDNYKLMNKDLVSDLFPDYNESEDSKRALYVGMTRAMQSLIISYYQNKADYIDTMQKSNLLCVERCGHGRGLNKFVCNDEEEDGKVKTLKSKEEMISMTYYKLIEYWKCKYAYKLRFHYNMIVPYKGELGYGSKIHTLLYHINLILAEEKDLTWEEILDKVPRKYFEDYKKYENKLKVYLNRFKKELKNITKPEMSFRFNTGNLIVDGRLDLLVKNEEGNYTIIEFKSGRYDNGILKKEKDKLRSAIEQIELYALAIKKDFNVTKGIVFFFGDGHKELFSINKKEINLKLINTISDINKLDFEPNKDKKVCQTCVFSEYKICPYNKYKGNTLMIDEDREEDYINDCSNNLF
jgi:DNA helicase II / ATP-dependent DNA helicase PcrA